jgi:hypothetical protein
MEVWQIDAVWERRAPTGVEVGGLLLQPVSALYGVATAGVRQRAGGDVIGEPFGPEIAVRLFKFGVVAGLDAGPDALFPLEQPAAAATTVTALTAINNSRLTDSPSSVLPRV